MVAVARIGKDRVVVFDTQLADRVRTAVAERTDFEEKKMFGGLAFMVNTHMACGNYSTALQQANKCCNNYGE